SPGLRSTPDRSAPAPAAPDGRAASPSISALPRRSEATPLSNPSSSACRWASPTTWGACATRAPIDRSRRRTILIASSPASSPTGPPPPAELAKIRAHRLSVLDRVAGRFARLSARLGTADRQKLEGHLAAIREIETRLSPGPTRPACAVPSLESGIDLRTND